MLQKKIILAGGPTASGKSATALRLAREQAGDIINADAMQVYAGLPLLSAQPTPDETKEIPHFLYATLDPAEPSSAGIWLGHAITAIEQSWNQGRTPIFVGGTGLYFRALRGGLAEIPPIPAAVREQAEQNYLAWGEEKFRAALAEHDPDSVAKLAPNDRQRLIRAYEVATHTGEPLSAWHEKGRTAAPALLDGAVYETHLLLPPRDELYAACDARFLKMVEKGALEEAKAFMERNLDPTLPAMKTIGLRELGAHLKGEMSLDEAIAKAQQATRNYAKRQVTWFKNQGFD